MTAVKPMRTGVVVTVSFVWKLFGQLNNIFLINMLSAPQTTTQGRAVGPATLFEALRSGCE
jgi:hypothetical protein